MSWNIEGLRRNAYNVLHFISTYDPLLVFLSEPQIFNCDIDNIKNMFSSYKLLLNSPDMFDLSLPLDKMKAKGGTLTMWHVLIDKDATP